MLQEVAVFVLRPAGSDLLRAAPHVLRAGSRRLWYYAGSSGGSRRTGRKAVRRSSVTETGRLVPGARHHVSAKE